MFFVGFPDSLPWVLWSDGPSPFRRRSDPRRVRVPPNVWGPSHWHPPLPRVVRGLRGVPLGAYHWGVPLGRTTGTYHSERTTGTYHSEHTTGTYHSERTTGAYRPGRPPSWVVHPPGPHPPSPFPRTLPSRNPVTSQSHPSSCGGLGVLPEDRWYRGTGTGRESRVSTRDTVVYFPRVWVCVSIAPLSSVVEHRYVGFNERGHSRGFRAHYSRAGYP